MTKIEEFKKDVVLIANKIGVKPVEIHIREMKRKLASCSKRGRLTFNKTLLKKPKEVRYQVILHELLHLKYPNHGRVFKLLLNIYLKKLINIHNKA